MTEPVERLGRDDMATHAEALFLAHALDAQRAAAVSPPPSLPGICANCGERCLPRAIYCDAGCREDHERRVRAERVRG